MSTGRKRAWVTVYRDEPTTNPDGQPVETPVKVLETWAEILPTGGAERFLGKQLEADVSHLVTVRSDTLSRAITPAMWIVTSDGRRIDIERAYDPTGRGKEIELQCKERIES